MDDDNEKTPSDPSTATSQGAGKSDNGGGDAPTEGKTAQDGGSASSQGEGKEGGNG